MGQSGNRVYPHRVGKIPEQNKAAIKQDIDDGRFSGHVVIEDDGPGTITVECENEVDAADISVTYSDH